MSFDIRADVYHAQPGEVVTVTMHHPREQQTIEACKRGKARASFQVTLHERGPRILQVSAYDTLDMLGPST